MSDKEVWKIIEKYPNYMISNLGKIKSLNYKRTGKEQILKQSINGRGYYYVLISINNKYKNILIHKAVAEAFLENDNNYSDVNHIDGNKLNNCITNLEFCTRSENIKHAYKNNLRNKQVGNTYKKRCELAIEYIENKNNGVCIVNGEEKDAYTFLLDFKKSREFVWQLLEILKGKE